MEKILEHMPLTEGEEVRAYLYGDSYTLDFSALARLVAFLIRIISTILGFSRKKHVFVTNKRVITVDFQKILWFINNGIDANSHTPRSIKEFGYTRRRSLLIFVTHYFSFNNTIVKAIGGKDKVYPMINAANNLAEKVSTQKESTPQLLSNEDPERNTGSALEESQIIESLKNLQWQTHYLKILSEK